MNNNRAYKDTKGRLIHFCIADGCKNWGSFGFPGNVWLCGEHKGQWDTRQVALAELAAMPVDEKQGKLL